VLQYSFLAESVLPAVIQALADYEVNTFFIAGKRCFSTCCLMDCR